MMVRMQVTHERRRISVFAGPPGIGKTTAIDAWRADHPRETAVVKVGRQQAKEGRVLQHVVEAVRELAGMPYVACPPSLWGLRNHLFDAMCNWIGISPSEIRIGGPPVAGFGRLTLVFDEAQNLSRQAIEALRYWNDPDRCYGPFPLGLVFVGNSEFSLAQTSPGGSVISDAVADRALYIQTLEYDDLTDDDIRLFVEANDVIDPGAVATILRSFRGARSIRSLRRVRDLIDDLRAAARGQPITRDTVLDVLEGV